MTIKLTKNQQTIVNFLFNGHDICRVKSATWGYEYLYDYSRTSNDNLSFTFHFASYKALVKKGLIREVLDESKYHADANYVTFKAYLTK